MRSGFVRSSRDLRILEFLTHDRIESGGAQQAFLLARELARRGHVVTVAMGIVDAAIAADTRGKIESAGRLEGKSMTMILAPK